MISQHRRRSFVGQPELGREDVHGSHRQKAESDVSAGNPVHDFVNGPIASGRDDSFETLRRRVPGETPLLPRPARSRTGSLRA